MDFVARRRCLGSRLHMYAEHPRVHCLKKSLDNYRIRQSELYTMMVLYDYFRSM